jgi:hypothetical protein
MKAGHSSIRKKRGAVRTSRNEEKSSPAVSMLSIKRFYGLLPLKSTI